ncbi:MAG: hypothetical protein CM15mP13_0340 [Pseudomonadota bacterium]|nr:MAG: hypothetical protein CM15mP13_0340 [Pseudomonadota bacterium]
MHKLDSLRFTSSTFMLTKGKTDCRIALQRNPKGQGNPKVRFQINWSLEKVVWGVLVCPPVSLANCPLRGLSTRIRPLFFLVLIRGLEQLVSKLVCSPGGTVAQGLQTVLP